jgi:hypothetical protein
MIKAEGLTRRFGSVEAVHNLSFHVESGSVYGLLGKNGSGKTTAIRLLLGLLWPNAGQSWVLGEDSLHLSPPCRQRIGYVSESGLPYDTLPMPALVRFVRGWFPQLDWRHTNELLQRFVVPTDRPLKQMSRGERRLCELILELAKQPMDCCPSDQSSDFPGWLVGLAQAQALAWVEMVDDGKPLAKCLGDYLRRARGTTVDPSCSYTARDRGDHHQIRCSG